MINKIINIKQLVRNFTPFLGWIPELKNKEILRADFIAGLTVALVLIPQSMAYAQLAGLPPYYGLYAAFLPPAVAAFFGSSRQLATGPVAVVSLMTAAALEPLATSGGAAYVTYAVLLAFMVGLFQLALGLLRLGVLVNFLSHPVVIGFTNAAAIIIATSQLSKIFGVSVEKMPHHYQTVWNTILAAIDRIHMPTFAIAVLAFGIMIFIKRFYPRLPGVLIAVTITTVLAWGTHFERVESVTLDLVHDEPVSRQLKEYSTLKDQLAELNEKILVADKVFTETLQDHGAIDHKTLDLKYQFENLKLTKQGLDSRVKTSLKKIMDYELLLAQEAKENIPAGLYLNTANTRERLGDERVWKITKVDLANTAVTLHSGGRVVGTIPSGLPAMKLPDFDWSVIRHLLSVAIAISLIGFMEAISIAKAMAARTRQRLDANQELIGQGLGNITGSLFQSYPTSGSFSRSAVNINAGSVTGFSSVVTSVIVVITLIWLTPLLYHLPQATLAAVIMMAVIGLVNFNAIRHAWHASRHDGIVSLLTFVLTLAFAPELEAGILIGVGLSLILYLLRTMKPRVVFLSKFSDGTLRDAQAFGLECCDEIAIIRFEGALYFANVSYFEDKIQEVNSRKPKLRYLIVDGVSINELDATGEEVIREITRRLGETGVEVLFTRLKKPILDMLHHTGFVASVGDNRFFRKAESALEYAWEKLGENHKDACPLNIYVPLSPDNPVQDDKSE